MVGVAGGDPCGLIGQGPRMSNQYALVPAFPGEGAVTSSDMYRHGTTPSCSCSREQLGQAIVLVAVGQRLELTGE